MADKEIANLAAAAALDGTELLHGDQGGNSRKITTKAIANLAQPYEDVASGSTTNIGAASSRFVNITGTDTITAFDTAPAGTVREGKFAGSLLLTYNGTSMILIGGANITTQAGDTFKAVSLGSGNWEVRWYQRADGSPLVSKGWTWTSRETASGDTAIDFTSIPNAKKIVMFCHDLSLSGSDNILFQVGVSGTPVTSGYNGLEARMIATSIVYNALSSAFVVGPQNASRCFTGEVILTKNTNGGADHWECRIEGVDDENDQGMFHCIGHITLAGALDMIRVTRSGSNTIAGGTLDVGYEV